MQKAVCFAEFQLFKIVAAAVWYDIMIVEIMMLLLRFGRMFI